jgi:hypothetical protein
MELFDLFETRIASLYHGCGIGGAVQILKANTIEDRTFQFPRPGSPFTEDVTGVSLSRSMQIAKTFGSVILQLDWPKLSQRFKIEPIDYWGHSNEVSRGIVPRRRENYAEAEEFVLGPITNLGRYLLAIHIDRKHFHRYVNNFHTDDDLGLLRRHPLLRIHGDPPASAFTPSVG